MPINRKAFRFFLENAGWSTPPGRAACAIALARAEALLEDAESEGVASVDWEYDDFPVEDMNFTPEEIAAKFDSNEWTGPFVCLLRVNGDVVASCGGIVLGQRGANDPYARVMAAELALDAVDEIRQALGDTRDERRFIVASDGTCQLG